MSGMVEVLVALTNFLDITQRTRISAERLLAEKRKADAEGRALTPEYLAQIDAEMQDAIDRLRNAQRPPTA